MLDNEAKAQLRRLEPDALSPLYAMLLELLGDVEHAIQSAEMNKDNVAAMQERKRRVDQAAYDLGHWLHHGYSEDQAVEKVMVNLELDETAVRFMLRPARKISKGLAKEVRNREIMQLVATGWTDSKIGEKYGLSRGYVNTLIGRMRRKAIKRGPV